MDPVLVQSLVMTCASIAISSHEAGRTCLGPVLLSSVCRSRSSCRGGTLDKTAILVLAGRILRRGLADEAARVVPECLDHPDRSQQAVHESGQGDGADAEEF